MTGPDERTGLLRQEGRVYVVNLFDPARPVHIDVTTGWWRATYRGMVHHLSWDDLVRDGLTARLVAQLQPVVIRVLRQLAPSSLVILRHVLTGLARYLDHRDALFEDFTLHDLKRLKELMHPRDFSQFRALYHRMATEQMNAGMQVRYQEMAAWQLRRDVVGLRDVLEWSETGGALTIAECDLLRRYFMEATPKSFAAQGVLLYGWLLLETGQRASQILTIPADGFAVERLGDACEYVVSVPQVKAQTGRPTRNFYLSEALGQALQRFSARPFVREAQAHSGHLIVWDVDVMYARKEIPTGMATNYLTASIKRAGLISPRTGKPLHVNALRLRHTMATRMAFCGRPLRDIQDMLGHDSPASAQAYLDAVSGLWVPLSDRADRALGGALAGNNTAYFRGQIVDEVVERPVYIPTADPLPVVIGGCGRNVEQEGPCPKHPFVACYDGCPKFRAWEGGDHQQSLRYADEMLRRLRSSEDSAARSKSVMLVESFQAAVQQVIAQIAQKDQHDAAR